MRVLLDECVPRRFRRELPEHEVHTVPETGRASFQNGLLLAAASGKFDVLVTTDQRLSDQNIVSTFTIAVIILVARRNKLEFLLPLVPELKIVLGEVKAGEIRRVGAPVR